jgi:glycosyltransferase involved in cell wall biosynthesis
MPAMTPPDHVASVATAAAPGLPRSAFAPAVPAVVDLVVPTYNEARIIEASLAALDAHIAGEDGYRWRIVVVDNGSTDGTAAVAERVAGELGSITVVRLPRKGRGGALRAAWSSSDADVVAYMDADLSTDLAALGPLVDAVVVQGADVAIGSRLVPGAQLVRRTGRDVLSRVYNLLLRGVLQARFRDAQCGFKALSVSAARSLLPLVEDDGWFFDTELLVAAQRSGLTIVELPVHWTDDTDSRVEVLPTVLSDLRGVWRVWWHRPRVARREDR